MTDRPPSDAPSDRPPSDRPGPYPEREASPETLAEVLASIRALVSAETLARVEGRASAEVIHLTADMRIDAADGPGAALAEGLPEPPAPAPPAAPAPILDEELLRAMINRIVREELQGELGERIGRNLRKLIRREIAQMLDEVRKPDAAPAGVPEPPAPG